MLNPESLCELLSSCKREGISTAVDTAGYVPFSSFERVLPVTDVFLYDVKAITPDLHERYTGAGNAQILSNLKKLFALGAKVIIRVPVVKEVNGNREEMQKIADFLKPYRPEKVELLPYHRLGEGKYAALGRQPTCFTAPTEDEMREFNSFFAF